MVRIADPLVVLIDHRVDVGGADGGARRAHGVGRRVEHVAEAPEFEGQAPHVLAQGGGPRALELLVARVEFLVQRPEFVVAGVGEVPVVSQVGLDPGENAVVVAGAAPLGVGGGVEDRGEPVDEPPPHGVPALLDRVVEVDARVHGETPLEAAEQVGVGGSAVEAEPLVRVLGVTDVPEVAGEPVGVLHRLGRAHGRDRTVALEIGEDVDGVGQLFAVGDAFCLGDSGICPLLLWKVLVCHGSSSGRSGGGIRTVSGGR